MESKNKLFEKFTARIKLSKKSFFGFNDSIINLWITYNFKIIQIKSYNFDLKNLPINQDHILDIRILKNWAIQNNFSISFTTKNSTLKRDLFGEFEDIIHSNDIQKKKYKNDIITNTKTYDDFYL